MVAIVVINAHTAAAVVRNALKAAVVVIYAPTVAVVVKNCTHGGSCC